jgi:ABC-type microcin C transport system permease subunit YejB
MRQGVIVEGGKKLKKLIKAVLIVVFAINDFLFFIDLLFSEDSYSLTFPEWIMFFIFVLSLTLFIRKMEREGEKNAKIK